MNLYWNLLPCVSKKDWRIGSQGLCCYCEHESKVAVVVVAAEGTMIANEQPLALTSHAGLLATIINFRVISMFT